MRRRREQKEEEAFHRRVGEGGLLWRSKGQDVAAIPKTHIIDAVFPNPVI